MTIKMIQTIQIMRMTRQEVNLLSQMTRMLAIHVQTTPIPSQIDPEGSSCPPTLVELFILSLSHLRTFTALSLVFFFFSSFSFFSATTNRIPSVLIVREMIPTILKRLRPNAFISATPIPTVIEREVRKEKMRMLTIVLNRACRLAVHVLLQIPIVSEVDRLHRIHQEAIMRVMMIVQWQQ